MTKENDNFPHCAKNCKVIKDLGADECENVCPMKFGINEKGDRMKPKYDEMIRNFVKEIIDVSKDPLDGDETEEMACLFHIELDYQSGNITAKEYEERLKK